MRTCAAARTTAVTAPLVVPSRFNGPPRSGNGGWTCGALAARVPVPPGQVVQVRLSAPPPLEVPLELRVGEGRTVAVDGQRVVASAGAVVSPFTDPAPGGLGWDAALAAETGYRGASDHPFPTCFTCGTGRPASDGLGLRPGPLPERPDVTACTWVPGASLTGSDDEQRVTPEVTWAALDCPGGWSLDLAGRPMVLGTMTAQVEDLPRVGERHVVMGRVLQHQGRKAQTETALYAVDADGAVAGSCLRLLARASAVWIEVDPRAVVPL